MAQPTPMVAVVDASTGQVTYRPCTDLELAQLTAAQAVAAATATQAAADTAARAQALAWAQGEALSNPGVAALMSLLGIPLTGGLPT